MMTDIHQHLLWGMDDGAQDRETMYGMLREANRQGIGMVIATSHAEPGCRAFDLGRCMERLCEAQSFCRSENLNVQILPGAEIAWANQAPLALLQGKVPTMGGSDYVLVELWPDISWQMAAEAVDQLTRAGYCPVLSHPERYRAFLLSPKKAARFRKETGALLQINGQTLLKPRGVLEQRFVDYMLAERALDAVASDAHNCEARPINLAAARDWLACRTDGTYARELTTFGGVFA